LIPKQTALNLPYYGLLLALYPTGVGWNAFNWVTHAEFPTKSIQRRREQILPDSSSNVSTILRASKYSLQNVAGETSLNRRF
jgi:hypothetical protein